MKKRLYKVYLTRFQGFHETGIGNICRADVINLGEDIFFETVGRQGDVYWRAMINQTTKVPVYCHEKNLHISHEELKQSVWKYDREKNHILLYVKVVVSPSKPPPVKEEVQIEQSPDPPTMEEFEEYLKALRPYSRSLLDRMKDYNLTDEDKKHLDIESGFKKTLGGLPKKEKDRRERLVKEVLYLNDEIGALENVKIEDGKDDKTEKNKICRKPLIFVSYALLICGCLLASFFFGIGFRGNGTAEVTTNVTPSQSPTVQSSLPTLIPLSSPTLLPTTQGISGSLRPTERPTIGPIDNASSQPPTQGATLLPTFMPTFFILVIPTTQPTSLITSVPTNSPSTNPTISPSKNPTMSPTQIPTNNSTNSPSTKPTIQPISLNTASPTFSPSAHPSFSPTLHPTNSPSKEAPISPVILPSASPTTAPSRFPTTGSPTLFPSVQQTEFPTISPTIPPSQQIKSRLTCNEIRETKAATEGNFGDNNFKIEIIDEKEYCGDTYGGIDPERSNRNKWSVRNGRRDCPTFSYEDGSDVCDTVGARWCSLEELELLVGKGTGCGGDKLLIYSSTDCEDETGLKGKMKYAPGSQAVRFPNYECEVDLLSETLVRCCGDY